MSLWTDLSVAATALATACVGLFACVITPDTERRGFVRNMWAGLMLRIRGVRGRPVQVGPHLGQVERIGTIGCWIRCEGGEVVIVPNSELLDRGVAGVSAPKASLQLIRIAVTHNGDLGRVVDTMTAAVVELEGIRATPSPRVVSKQHQDGAVLLTVSFWLEPCNEADAKGTCSAARICLLEVLDQHGVEILPMPQR